MSEAKGTREDPRVILGRLVRPNTSSGRRWRNEATREEGEIGTHPGRLVLALALGHWLARAIDRGEAKDQASAGRKLSLSRARVTQLVDLTLLSPSIQKEILFFAAPRGMTTLAEREVRQIVRIPSWHGQERAWRFLTRRYSVVTKVAQATR